MSEREKTVHNRNAGVPMNPKQMNYIIFFRDNHTSAEVNFNGLIGKGIARCNPVDSYNMEIGENIATARALQDLGESLESLWIKRAKTKEEVITSRMAKRKLRTCSECLKSHSCQ